jgi:hypothetical protein
MRHRRFERIERRLIAQELRKNDCRPLDRAQVDVLPSRPAICSGGETRCAATALTGRLPRLPKLTTGLTIPPASLLRKGSQS